MTVIRRVHFISPRGPNWQEDRPFWAYIDWALGDMSRSWNLIMTESVFSIGDNLELFN